MERRKLVSEKYSNRMRSKIMVDSGSRGVIQRSTIFRFLAAGFLPCLLVMAAFHLGCCWWAYIMMLIRRRAGNKRETGNEISMGWCGHHFGVFSLLTSSYKKHETTSQKCQRSDATSCSIKIQYSLLQTFRKDPITIQLTVPNNTMNS